MNKTIKTILPCTIKRTLVFRRTKSFVQGINTPPVGIGRRIVQGLIISIAVLGTVFLFVNPVSAQPPADNLVVQFQPNPLFNVTNFLPGDTVTGLVTVTNNTTGVQKIGTQAINVTNNDGLGSVMYLEIKEGLTTLYTGTLSAFFGAGEIYLSDLAGGGANTTYYYSITFASDAGDNYQGKGLSFDIAVGFLGESISQQISSGGSTSGSGTSTAGLIISNEAITVAADTATITWDTNLISTSRVIYSPSTSPPVFNINNPPNYGYAQSTIEDTGKVLHHTVVISGLNPATVYFFRCVSHASPDTLSPEYSFTTLGPGETLVEGEQQLGEQMGEVLGEAIIRTGLPETGGIFDKIAKSAGFSSSQSNEIKINLLIGAGLIFIWIVLFLIRWSIKRQRG